MTMAKQFNEHDAVSATEFVTAMGAATTQVTIVTTDGPAGKFGVTVSAFASVSAEPPLVLVCVNKRSPAVAAIDENGGFCVNLLGSSQSDVSDCFAGRSESHAPYDFNCAEWGLGKTRSPMLTNATANFDCEVEAARDAGTHRIFIGRVVQTATAQTPPLAFSQRAYQSLSPLEKPAN